jgi:hypothetical protein
MQNTAFFERLCWLHFDVCVVTDAGGVVTTVREGESTVEDWTRRAGRAASLARTD